MRAFIIAVRYGYVSKIRAKILSAEDKGWEYVSTDLLVPQWLKFNPDNIAIEIDAAMWRN